MNNSSGRRNNSECTLPNNTAKNIKSKSLQNYTEKMIHLQSQRDIFTEVDLVNKTKGSKDPEDMKNQIKKIKGLNEDEIPSSTIITGKSVQRH